MTNPKKKVKTDPQDKGEIGINFGNVDSIKMTLANDSNKLTRSVLAILQKIDATLIRMESKYDANSLDGK